MSDFFQRIGQATTSIAGDVKAKILLYAEVEDGVISADLIFNLPGEQFVHFRFATEELRELIYQFWEAGEKNIAPKSWAAIQFVVSGGSLGRSWINPPCDGSRHRGTGYLPSQ